MVMAALVARDATHGPWSYPGHSHLRFPENILDHMRLRSPGELIDARAGDDAYVYHGSPVNLATLTPQLLFPFEPLDLPRSVLLWIEQLQHLLCTASDEHTTACRVHGDAVGLADGRVAGYLAGHAAIEGELDHTVFGGEGNPELIPPGVYDSAVGSSPWQRHAGGQL